MSIINWFVSKTKIYKDIDEKLNRKKEENKRTIDGLGISRASFHSILNLLEQKNRLGLIKYIKKIDQIAIFLFQQSFHIDKTNHWKLYAIPLNTRFTQNHFDDAVYCNFSIMQMFTIQGKIEKYIYIYDILIGSKNVNKGYGSIFMEHLIEFAKNENCISIKGVLGSADLCDIRDLDHKKRLLHFYKKFNFKIELNKNETYGQIELNL